MFKPIYDFEWDMMGIYNYNKEGRLLPYFDFLEKHLDNDGDLVEAGVFRGYSLLSVGLYLKEKKSDKKIYAYDSFAGFPLVKNENDSIDKFKDLVSQNRISEEHYDQVQSSLKIRKKFQENKMYALSTSGDFDNTSKALLEEKIKHLGLDNIILIDGPFSETMNTLSQVQPKKILGGILDCDLYNSIMCSLDFFWPKLFDNGCFFLDEYFSLKFPGARIAVDEFLSNHSGQLLKYQSNSLSFERWLLKKIKD
tara:strand:+ start:2699 stop:3454 length:756 start_codon:yes stop_codon:yes gene_type:complete